VVEKAFPVDVEECVARDASRSQICGEEVIRRMYERYVKGKGILKDNQYYYPPHTITEPANQDATLRHAVICDLDGTAANIDWRNPYDASKCDQDPPVDAVIELVVAMRNAGHDLVFVSGREDKFYEQTVKFLDAHVGGQYNLFMRKEGDKRKDTIVKREIYENHIMDKWYVKFVVDDRPAVVRMWRYDLGLFVLAVNDKEF